MKITATVTEVFRNFSDYINRVASRGERFVLVRRGVPVAELTPVETEARLGELAALLDSLPRLTAEEAAALVEDLDRARSGLEARPPGDPWAC